MQKGCTQLYYGDGKGKTTAAMGQIVRCVGHGFKVLVYQFLKEPNSGEVSIIHGNGTGVLRAGIQDCLRRHPCVSSFRLGRYGEGETGVTIVSLK